MTDTTAEAVERLAETLDRRTWPVGEGIYATRAHHPHDGEAAATLRALVAERDAARAEAARMRDRVPMWLVVNIGCIECGVSSNVVGVFASKDRAEIIADKLQREMSWREGGQNAYEVFPVPAPDAVAEEYRAALGGEPAA